MSLQWGRLPNSFKNIQYKIGEKKNNKHLRREKTQDTFVYSSHKLYRLFSRYKEKEYIIVVVLVVVPVVDTFSMIIFLNIPRDIDRYQNCNKIYKYVTCSIYIVPLKPLNRTIVQLLLYVSLNTSTNIIQVRISKYHQEHLSKYVEHLKWSITKVLNEEIMYSVIWYQYD